MVYSKHEFVVIKHKGEFIVINSKKQFKDGHTHIRKLDTCKVIIDNVHYKRLPETNDLYLIQSHMRLTTDKKYTKSLTELYDYLMHDNYKNYGRSTRDKVKQRYRNYGIRC